jgi:hypothetical protein|tara:strand:+ start:133 stop:462 length:330 start_codon:yes stop_codon:yes gene_type:complete
MEKKYTLLRNEARSLLGKRMTATVNLSIKDNEDSDDITVKMEETKFTAINPDEFIGMVEGITDLVNHRCSREELRELGELLSNTERGEMLGFYIRNAKIKRVITKIKEK